MSIRQVEVAIIGAGIAGLSLATQLKLDNPDLDIAVVGPVDDRNQRISTWLPNAHNPSPLLHACIDKHWGSWQFADLAGKQHHHSAQAWRYVTLDGRRFKQAQAALADQLGVVQIHDSCHRVKDTGKGYQIFCGDHTLLSTQVVDTRPPAIPEGTVKQQFVGHTIVCEQAHNYRSPVLMDFSVAPIANDGLTFIYCLPLSERELLVEATTFSPTLQAQEDYEACIERWLATHLPSSSTWRLSDTETGVLPMGPTQPINADLVRCGIAGGAARASTGYAWHGTQRQVQRMAARFATSSTLSTLPSYSLRARWMDRVFLRVLKHQPESVYQLFMAMARDLPGDLFAQFLCDEGGWTPCLKTIQVAPKRPFIRALWRS